MMSLKSLLREVAEIAISAAVRCAVEVVVERVVVEWKERREKEDG